MRFHDLRHTYATLMVAAGAHAKYLQAQMGHASIRVTLDLYGHLYPDANRTVLRELDRLIDAARTRTLTAARPIHTPSPARHREPLIHHRERGSAPAHAASKRRERRDSNPRPPA